MLAHFKVFAIAAVFGLAAYAVIRIFLHLSQSAGLLGWLR